MLKRMLAIAVVLAVAGVGVASADDVVSVPFADWAKSQTLDDDATGWSASGVTLSWQITKAAGIYTYKYTWSEAVTQFVLEASPGKTALSFSWQSGYDASVSWPGSTSVTDDNGSTVVLTNAITFTPPTGQNAITSVTFRTKLGPVFGDAQGSKSSTGGYANNPLIGVAVDEGVNSTIANYVPIPDTGWSTGDIIIPEPSLSVLALTALLAGAVARRRKKETEV